MVIQIKSKKQSAGNGLGIRVLGALLVKLFIILIFTTKSTCIIFGTFKHNLFLDLFVGQLGLVQY